MSNSTATKGQGILQVSATLWDVLDKPVTSQEWHKALLLPDAYEIEHITPPLDQEYSTDQAGYYTLYVNHAAIPVAVGATYLPIVTPIYYRHYARDASPLRVELACIEIMQWNGEAWKQVAVTDEKED